MASPVSSEPFFSCVNFLFRKKTHAKRLKAHLFFDEMYFFTFWNKQHKNIQFKCLLAKFIGEQKVAMRFQAW